MMAAIRFRHKMKTPIGKLKSHELLHMCQAVACEEHFGMSNSLRVYFRLSDARLLARKP